MDWNTSASFLYHCSPDNRSPYCAL
jgi:hypothetical protein